MSLSVGSAKALIPLVVGAALGLLAWNQFGNRLP